MPEIVINGFTFNRTRTRTYDTRSDPAAVIEAIIELLCPAGTIVPTMAQTEPGQGWKLCDGQSLLQADFPRLFAIIGVTFGGTDSTFNLPDLRGKMPFGASGAHPLFSTGGAASITLTVDQLPAHGHKVTDPGHGHDFEGIAHGHDVIDPGHIHTIADPGHAHTITDPGHTHSAATVGKALTSGTAKGSAVAGATGNQTTGITVNSAVTGITVNSAVTGITVADAVADGTVASAVTGITVEETGGGAAVPTLPPYIAVNWMVRT